MDLGPWGFVLPWDPVDLGSWYFILPWYPVDPGPWGFVLPWDLADLGSWYFILPWYPVDLGPLRICFAVRSCRSWILRFQFAVGSCGSWILFFGHGTSLVKREYFLEISGPPWSLARDKIYVALGDRSPRSGARELLSSWRGQTFGKPLCLCWAFILIQISRCEAL